MKSGPRLVDSHCHLTDPRLRDEIAPVAERAHQAGLVAAIVVGTSAANSHECVELCEGSDWMFPTAGLHPCHLLEEPFEPAWGKVESLARLGVVRALGETGLDNYWKEVPLDLQEDSLRRHLSLSRELDKPVILHCRDAADRLLLILGEAARSGPVSGVLHSFAGTEREAEAGLAAGLHLSFSGIITYPKNENLRRVAAVIPNDRILIETDAPYLAPQPWRGKRNEPSHMVATCEALARARGQTFAEVAALTTANAFRLFRLGPPPTPNPMM
ncbi:MAG: TatD family hydrolase [Planctomycetota bacterium]